MAIARVSGKALASNLTRDTNLAVDTSTLFIDVANNRVGIGTDTPAQPLHAPGTAKIANLTLAGNAITSESTLNLSGSPVNLGANSAVTITGGTTGQILTTNGSGTFTFTTISTGGNQNIFQTVDADTGTTTANSTTDTLTVAGGANISTSITKYGKCYLPSE